MSENVYIRAAILGAVAGLRSMAAPALISRAAHAGQLEMHDHRLRFLGSGTTANIFTALAAGELVADKTPVIPSRLAPPSLGARIASGGLSGAALCAADRESALTGAVIGGIAAIGSAFAGYHVRRWITKDKGFPDFPVALTEDVVAFGAGLAALGTTRSGSASRHCNA